MDIEVLSARRFMNALDNYYVQDAMLEEHIREARDNSRAKLLQAYNEGVVTLNGVANDNQPTLPYQETPQTEEGFIGLEAPMG